MQPETFETFEHAGFTCELYPDWDATSPAEWDNLGELYQFGRAWLNGAKDAPGDIEEAHERRRAGLTIRALRMQGDAAVLFQFQDYGSSGARILALDDDDDDIATGYIAGNLARILEEGPVDGDWRRALRGELTNWDNYVQGNVAGYMIRDEHGEVLDSCWGFYPDDEGDGWDYLRDEIREQADWFKADREAKRLRVMQGWALAHSITS